MASISLPQNLKLTPKDATSVLGSKNYDFNVQDTIGNGNYYASSAPQFNMQTNTKPISKPSKLQFVDNNPFQTFIYGLGVVSGALNDVHELDNSAHAFFYRSNEVADGKTLADSDGLNRYIPNALNFTMDQSQRLYGYNPMTCGSLTTIGSGKSFTIGTANFLYGFEFNIPLPGALIGIFNADKWYPISIAPYVLTLYIDTTTNIFYTSTGSATPTQFYLTNLNINLNIIEFNEIISSIIYERLSDLFVYSFQYIYHKSDAISPSPGVKQVNVLQKIDNAKMVMFVVQLADESLYNRRSLTGNSRLAISDVHLTIGQDNYPQNIYYRNLINADTTASTTVIGYTYADSMTLMRQTLKAFNSDAYNTTLAKFNASEAADSSSPGTFVMAFSLECNNDNSNSIRSCTPINSNLTLQFTTNATTSETSAFVHTYILYEADLVIETSQAININVVNRGF
jgi:hypothetical protein